MTPNLIVILVDDLGWTDLSCYGSDFYETPHLDALAAGGARFTQAYAAAPVCSPSRAALMTGKWPARVGVTNFIGGHAVGRLADVPYFHGLPRNEHSLARALADGGYATWHVGKWHLGERLTSPETHGFAVNVGGCGLGHPPSYFSPYGIPTLADGPVGEYLTGRLTDEAVRLIDEHDQQRPFFLNLWHYTVHTPIQAPQPLIDKYRAKADRLGLDTEPLVDGEPMPAWHLDGIRVRRRTRHSHPGYAAMIETLDDSVGAIVEALRRTGQLDRTVIVFTSDNGGLATAEGSPTCNAPLAEGKGWMEDGGLRVPLIVSGPGVEPLETDALTSTPDLYPTLLGLAGVEPPAWHRPDGVDLAPAAYGQPFDRGPLFWHYPHYSNQGGTPGAAVREGRWKLIRWYEDGRQALYDLAAEVGERDDRAAAEPELVGRLAGLLDDWLLEVGALVPAANPAVSSPRLGL
ncbi:sulfatase [Microlunatus parietis]|uniref:Arylsulfatase A-like enzyme n=1 Tax=Microlunatus parietis TaxID=682979 RepID=A0A7Y9LF15_9ACTN|nr:sulfatase [Microlunatus parietis]NYE73621.1 arylsulfatase A-like enzyme [Microlunatus parietis]